MTLYEIASEYQSALDNIQINEDGEIINYEEIEAAEGEFDAKTEAIACYIKDLEAFAENLKTEKDALDQRMKSAAKKAEWLRSYLAGNMHIVGKTKFETTKCKLSFRKSTSVNVLDESLIPADYMTEKVTYSPNKTLIKDALKHGTVVAGAELVEKESLQIK